LAGNLELYDTGEELLNKVLADPECRQHWLDGLFNKWFRLNVFYDIKNDDGKVIPFRANDAQVDLFINQHYRDICLKARQLGFTTFEMLDALDSCLFVDNFNAVCIAHDRESVVDIFDNKVKFAYESLDFGIFQKITNGQFSIPNTRIDSAHAYKFSNGSKIRVATSSRGGTVQKLHISEFGKICKKYPEKAKEIVTGSFESVAQFGHLSIESTAEGKEGYFFNFCEGAKDKTEHAALEFKLHFYPWHGKPAYSSVDGEINPSLVEYFDELEHKHEIHLSDGQKRWYSLKYKTLGDDIFREHPSTYDECFKVSVEGAYYKKEFLQIYKDGRIGEPLNTKFSDVCTAWDIGTSDSTAIWFYIHIGNEIHVIGYYENHSVGLEHYLKVLSDKGYQYKTHYAPHDMDNRQYAVKAKTLKELASEGLEAEDGFTYSAEFTIVPKIGVNDGIAHVRNTLKRSYFYDNGEIDKPDDFPKVTVAHGVKCLENHKKIWDDKGGFWQDKPKHDWTSDGSDGFRYLSVAENLMIEYSGTNDDPF